MCEASIAPPDVTWIRRERSRCGEKVGGLVTAVAGACRLVAIGAKKTEKERFMHGKDSRQPNPLPAAGSHCQPFRRRAFVPGVFSQGCGSGARRRSPHSAALSPDQRKSAPVTRVTWVMESKGRSMAACASAMARSSGPAMKQ